MLGLHCCRGFSLVLARDILYLGRRGFSLWWFLLLQPQGSRAQAQQMWGISLVAPWHVEVSRTRNQTGVSCTGMWTLPLSHQGSTPSSFLKNLILFMSTSPQQSSDDLEEANSTSSSRNGFWLVWVNHYVTILLAVTVSRVKDWTSLMVQWISICLPMQETQVWSLVQEDSSGWGSTKPMGCNCWAGALGPASLNYWARVLQLLRPAHLEPREAQALQGGAAPAPCN